ncbi:MAG: TRAP transporter substrate-binding protein DctP [Alphaproteobacteria bacterium]|nr:TRAP transporter substrate-binding protein DctP [Alphaproteobacteria bacterium]
MRQMLTTALTAALLAAAPAAAQQPQTFKMTAAVSGGDIYELGAKAFITHLDFLTEGRIKIQLFPGGSLGNPLKVSETVKTGVADMGFTAAGYDWGIDPTTALFNGYSGHLGAEIHMHWVYEGGGMELWQQYREEKFGVKAIPLLLIPAEVGMHARKPIRSLADFKGIKLRTAGAWNEVVQEFGASPVALSMADAYQALERGVVDAIEFSTASHNIQPGFHKIAKYIIIPGIHQPEAFWEIDVNPAAWAKIGERDKKLFALAAKITSLEGWMKTNVADAKAFDVFRANGNEIIRLSDADRAEAHRKSIEWAEKKAKDNPWFAKVLASQREFEKTWQESDKRK